MSILTLSHLPANLDVTLLGVAVHTQNLYRVLPEPSTTAVRIKKTGPGLGWVDFKIAALGITRRAMVEYPDVGYRALLDVAAGDPSRAATIRVLAEAARSYASSLMDIGMDADRANAVQHAYWNALITISYDSSQAALFTTAHEYSNRFVDGAAATDCLMDLHNNYVGREIADAVSGPDRVTHVKFELARAAYDGRLWIFDTANGSLIRSDNRRIYGSGLTYF